MLTFKQDMFYVCGNFSALIANFVHFGGMIFMQMLAKYFLSILNSSFKWTYLYKKIEYSIV